MKKTSTTISKQNIDVTRVALGTALILLIPFIGQWPWTLGDFVIMGMLIAATGIGYELITKKFPKQHRTILIIALITLFIFTWAELAVGIIGTPFAGN